MANGEEPRTHGRMFDGIADAYDRHRPRYPEALIDRACEVGRLAAGARVLEIGCGTGQLTRSLLARGLRVTAVEPGARLIARAAERLAGAGEVRFVNRRLEEAGLDRSTYQAVFCASAIHWVDPEVSWRRIADALVDGGTLALVSYFGVEDPRSHQDQEAFRAELARIAPELASEWPSYRDLGAMFAGVDQRRANVSEVWGWLGGYELARPYAAELFGDVRLTAMPLLMEHSADALNGLLGTMSFWGRLSARQREALVAGNQALHERLGRPIRSGTAACLATARRSPDGGAGAVT